jgi:hypothetical protein
MMNQQAAQSIVRRHRPDSEEHGDTCLSCGRPWPCDVSRLAAVAGLDDASRRSRSAVLPGRPRLANAARRRGVGVATLLPRTVVLQPV